MKGIKHKLNEYNINSHPSNKKQQNLPSSNMLHRIIDYGPHPYVVNIREATLNNHSFRMTEWTGNHLQLTLMSIPIGDAISLAHHDNFDEFIKIKEGQGIVKMGTRRDRLNYQANITTNYAFIVPAGTWHTLINTGDTILKLYCICSPPQHPHNTIHPVASDVSIDE